MKKTKTALIIATVLSILGLAIFGGVMTMLKWNFKNLSTTKYQTSEYTLTEKFTDISISIDTADIEFIPHNDDTCKVVCFEEIKAPVSVTSESGELVISQNTKNWYNHIGINFETPKIRIYLPEKEYGKLVISDSTGDVEIPSDLAFVSIDISASTGDIDCASSVSGEIKIKVSTGDVALSSTSADTIDITTTTGKIELKDVECASDISLKLSTGKVALDNVECKNLFSLGTTGDISLTAVIASEKLSIERDTGDVTLSSSDASEIFIKASTGKVVGTLKSEKIFYAQSNTGRINVPKTENGGRCEITTDTGKINIAIE